MPCTRCCVFEEFLAKVLELLQKTLPKLLAPGLLSKLHPGLPVLFEEHDLQDLKETGVIRAENCQCP